MYMHNYPKLSSCNICWDKDFQLTSAVLDFCLYYEFINFYTIRPYKKDIFSIFQLNQII